MMRTTRVAARDLTAGMTVLLDPRTVVTVLTAYPIADGHLIWVELSNGATGTVTPRNHFDVVTGL